MQRSEISKGSTTRKSLVASRTNNRCSSAEAAVWNDESSALPVARSKPWAAARCRVISGEIVALPAAMCSLCPCMCINPCL